MKFNDISKELTLLSAIIDDWVTSDSVSDLERDMVLDKLRNIYSDIKYAEVTPVAQGFEQELNFDALVSVKDVVVQKPPVVMQESEFAVQSIATVTEPVSVLEPIALVEELVEVPVPVAVSEFVSTPAEEVIAESAPKSSPKPLSKPVITDDIIMSRPKVDRRLINTLYGDDKIVAKPAGESQLVSDVNSNAMQPKRVLGEVMGGGTAINEVLGRQNHHSDVASKIYTQKVDSLRHNIGINDRFLLIRDLFRGDVLKYDTTITALDGFTDFDDAMLYIQENFSWGSDNKSVDLLIDLLERKLGL